MREPEIPEYVFYDPTDLDAFLSRIGMFTPDQRTIFAALCRNKEAVLDYDKQLRNLNLKNAIGELDALLSRLSKDGYAVVRKRKNEKGEWENKSIILTEQHSITFFYYRLYEELKQLLDEPWAPFPTPDELEERGIALFGKYIADLDKEELSAATFKEHENELTIFRVPAMRTSVLVPAAQLAELVQFAIKKVHAFLMDNDLLAAVARANGSNLNEIAQRMRTKSSSAWLQVSAAVLRFYKSRDRYRKLTFDDSLFQAAYILRYYLQNEVNAAVEQRREKESFETDAKAVETAVRNSNQILLDQSELNAFLAAYRETYGDRYQAFCTFFYEQMVGSSGKLSPIVSLDGQYIHSLKYYPRFVEGLDRVGKALHVEYVNKMMAWLRRGNEQFDCFQSKEAFRGDVEQRLGELDPFLKSALERPNLFGEAVIKFMKMEEKDDDLDKIKALLLQYVQSENMRFRSVVRLCRLDIERIFEEGFASLPLFMQIWQRLTGRYTEDQKKFKEWAAKSIRRGTAAQGNSFYGSSASRMFQGGVATDVRLGRTDAADVGETEAAQSTDSHRGPADAAGRSRNGAAIRSAKSGAQRIGKKGTGKASRGKSAKKAAKRSRRRKPADSKESAQKVSEKFARRRSSEQYRKDNAQKIYSNRERESAWDEFGKALK